jgi:hypothetical protein
MTGEDMGVYCGRRGVMPNDFPVVFFPSLYHSIYAYMAMWLDIYSFFTPKGCC